MRHRPTPTRSDPSTTRSDRADRFTRSTRSTRSDRSGAARTAAAAGVLLGLATLVGCGGDGGDDTAVADPDAALEQLQDDSGVPEECREAFPVAMGPADLADLSMLPVDWPEAPAGATLCQTSATLDAGVETADFATGALTTEVLDALEESLAPAYAVERGDEGLGEQLTGTAGNVVFEVTTREGAYTVTLAAAG